MIHVFALILSLAIVVNGCKPRCNTIQMDDGVVPAKYKNCTCVREQDYLPDYDFVFEDSVSSCIPLFRSLKFRNATTGKVLLHKAVTRACVGEGRAVHIDQTDFHEQEKNYYYRLLMQKHSKVGSSISSWLLGFRSPTSRDDPDNHLRFG